jgi:hypothetical protein
MMPADAADAPSWGWVYLDRFCQFQADMSVISFRSSQALRWKLAEFYSGVELQTNLEHENLPKTLTEYRQFLTTSTEWAKEDALIQRDLVERERMIDDRMREAAAAKKAADEKAARLAAQEAARAAAEPEPAQPISAQPEPKRFQPPPDPSAGFSDVIADDAP